jgi:hypothetical protein
MQLKTLCDRSPRVRADFRYGEAKDPGWPGAAHNWRVTLRYRDRKITTDFFGGEAITNPSAADVLGSLIMDATSFESAQSFEGWCGDYGYDTDSRRAFELWHWVEKLAPRVRAFLGADFDRFAEAEY